ncbi:putative quinol monooxygenase [Mucilaginibacter glaciei]|uniref:Antibiotic biosynthesis monooxygenase n=1 Tax=Mucilaginibacter glaciei TaxID=2772109 RepID=A0A926NJD6_9SPHI|nr:putative quinol monooxygenase [Mucilaginibacter glaciei]MBD1393164.1 antibiotic biosynthesis monooxygenase [Mucilaginibacter glaciei]
MSVSLLASLQCKKDAVAAFNIELKKLMDASKAEPGCIAYDIYQYKDEFVRFVVVDEWTDDDALSAHMETPHYKYFVHILPALLEQQADVKILTRIV